MTDTDSGPWRQDGLTVETTAASFSGKIAVTDQDARDFQLERDAVLVVLVHTSGVGTKTVKGEVVRIPNLKVLEGRVVHDLATRARLLNLLGFDYQEAVPDAATEDKDGDEAEVTEPEPQNQYRLFDDDEAEDTPPAPVPDRQPGDLEVRDSDAPGDTLAGERVGRVRVADPALSRFLSED